MRVVVIGATGNVGTSLLGALGREESVTSILGLARRLPRSEFAKTTFAAADITRDDLAPHLRGADCVVHLAWLIQPSRDKATLWRTNVDGSSRVFAAAAGEPLDVDGLPVFVASLDDLIAMKEAAGRPRDQVVASELRLLADEINQSDR